MSKRQSQPDSKQWSNEPEKGSLLLLRLMLWFYQKLGKTIFICVLHMVIWWYWLFAKKARQNSLHYLSRLHQFAGEHSPFPKPPTHWQSLEHLQHFGISILDKMSAWLGEIPEQELQLFGHEHFRKYYHRGAILLVSHFGNIELLRAVKSDHVQMVNVLVYRKHAQQFNDFLQSINPKAAVRLISVDEMGVDTALFLQQRLDMGEWIVIAADRVPVQSMRQQEISFLGQNAAWPEGAWLMAHLLQAPVLAVFCYPYQRQLQVHIHLLTDNLLLTRRERQQALKVHMQQYVVLVEQHCIRAPYQWFNFYDFWNHFACQSHSKSSPSV